MHSNDTGCCLWRWALIVLLCGAGAAQSEDRALLVGVSDYPHLEKKLWLKGPTNDVMLVNELLRSEKFGFKADAITILAGWPADESKRPTKSNIEKAFKTLAQQSQKGDSCFILMTGHGSQQPARKDAKNPESDGLDELFIPADVEGWDKTARTVKNAIVDNELGEWIQAILAKGASVWIIFDSCNSGTMTRELSLSGRTLRQIDPALLVPASEMAAVPKPAAATRGAPGRTAGEGGMDLGGEAKGGLVAMYAAQSFEPTFEVPLPTETDGNHGVFTYALSRVLTAAESDMTFDELMETVQTFYLANDLLQPTPAAEGTMLDRGVFGKKILGARPAILMGMPVEDHEVIVRAGALHGLLQNTVLEVFPPAGTADSNRSLGCVKLTRVLPFFSLATPAPFEKRTAAAMVDLGYGCRCTVVYEPYGGARLTLALQHTVNGELVTCETGKGPEPVEAALKEILERNKTLFVRTHAASEAKWFIRVEGRDVLLIPGSGWSVRLAGPTAAASKPEQAPPAFKVARLGEKALEKNELESAMIRVAKVRQLLNVASVSEMKTAPAKATDVRIELVRFKAGDKAKPEVVQAAGGSRVLKSGDTVAFRITNPSSHVIDVTLLFVDSSFGIKAIFPERGTVDDNRLAPGQVLTTQPVEVTADTVGLEQVVAIAVRATRDRQDFCCLEQSTLERVRGGDGLDTPFGQLLKTALYGSGNTRGITPGQLESYKVRLLSWFTEP